VRDHPSALFMQFLARSKTPSLESPNSALQPQTVDIRPFGAAFLVYPSRRVVKAGSSATEGGRRAPQELYEVRFRITSPRQKLN
jgi:hypothetical protein